MQAKSKKYFVPSNATKMYAGTILTNSVFICSSDAFPSGEKAKLASVLNHLKIN